MGWLLALPVDALLSPPSSSMHGASRQSTSPLWPAKRAIEPNNLFGIFRRVAERGSPKWRSESLKREWTDLVYAVRTRLYALHVQCPHTSTLSNSILSGSRTVSAI
jgi:hypothetical protein